MREAAASQPCVQCSRWPVGDAPVGAVDRGRPAASGDEDVGLHTVVHRVALGRAVRMLRRVEGSLWPELVGTEIAQRQACDHVGQRLSP